MSRQPSPYLAAIGAVANGFGYVSETDAIAAIAALIEDATPAFAAEKAHKKIKEYRLGKKARDGRRKAPLLEHLYSEDGVRVYALTDHAKWLLARNERRAAA